MNPKNCDKRINRKENSFFQKKNVIEHEKSKKRFNNAKKIFTYTLLIYDKNIEQN